MPPILYRNHSYPLCYTHTQSSCLKLYLIFLALTLFQHEKRIKGRDGLEVDTGVLGVKSGHQGEACHLQQLLLVE